MIRLANWLSCLVLASVLTACSHIDSVSDDSMATDLSRQILITTRQTTGSSALSLVGDASSVYLRRRGYGPSPRVDRLLDGIAEDFGLQRVEGWPISNLGVYCEVYQVAGDEISDELLERIAGDARIESVQLMNVFQTQAMHYDDPYAPMQTALVNLEIETAHETATGRGVRIAVVDSRVDHRHPEIRGRVPIRRDLVRGRSGQAEVHGTAVAGIIASTANNAQGIVGVAPAAEIVSLRACWSLDEATGRAQCSSFSLARSIETAIELGVDIINLSLSGPRDPLLERLLDAALGEGVIIIAALPGAVGGADNFPASHTGVIAAADGFDGASIGNVLHAPGTEVLTTLPGDGYAFFSGNSMASAFVSGVTALLVEQRPDISAQTVVSLLNETSAGGSINACRALAALAPGTGSCQTDSIETSVVSGALSNTTH